MKTHSYSNTNSKKMKKVSESHYDLSNINKLNKIKKTHKE